MFGMKISRSSWDKWAPVAYIFIIGLVLGFVVGFAMGMTSGGGPNTLYFLLLPPAVIVLAFVTFTMIARKIGRDA